MAMKENDFVEHIEDLLQTIGPVFAKRMFGGHGFFLDGLMFALLDDHTLYLKVDDQTRPGFKALGLEAFTYKKQGKTCTLRYFQAPEECLEDQETMNQWANEAYEVARRAATQKSKKQHKPSK